MCGCMHCLLFWFCMLSLQNNMAGMSSSCTYIYTYLQTFMHASTHIFSCQCEIIQQCNVVFIAAILAQAAAATGRGHAEAVSKQTLRSTAILQGPGDIKYSGHAETRTIHSALS